MLGKQLLYLLAITATLSTLVIQFNNQSALAISAEEVGQQRGRETIMRAQVTISALSLSFGSLKLSIDTTRL